MTVEEFSNEFDTLVNSYRRFKALDHMELLDSLDFNEYEKSVFLTKAQEDIVKELYSGKYSGDSFESSELLRRELEGLVDLKDYTTSDIVDNPTKLSDNKYSHTVFKLGTDVLYIIYEQVIWPSNKGCLSTFTADVYPVTHDEYLRVRGNPFRGPNNKRVLRLDKGNSEVELIGIDTIGTYTVKYLKKPEPIVLTILPDETVDNVSTPQTCKLNNSLHREILERAVRLALSSKMINSDKGEKE